MEGRKWQDGLHQSIEAKEQVPITATSGEAARVTIQSFFRRYSHLAGMSGTAMQAGRELKKIYGMNVATIPTHRPCIRSGLSPRLLAIEGNAVLTIVESSVCMKKPMATTHSMILRVRSSVASGVVSCMECGRSAALWRLSG